MEAAFLKCITAEPDDATARLVFADWLREQDDRALNERGEFIHLQHALAEGNVSREDRPKLVARQKELLAQHRDRWEESFRSLVNTCEYRFGFAERVTLSVEQFVDGFEELTARTPVVRVKLSGLTADTVPVVAATETLAGLRELDLSGAGIMPPVLREFLASPHLGRLRSLNLARTPVGDEGVRALVASSVFPRLRYLNLTQTALNPTGVTSLVRGVLDRGRAMEILVLRGAPKLAPGTIPPLPSTLPRRLRQSLQSQFGLEVEPPDLLADLYATRATQRDDLRQFVEWLQPRGHGQLAGAVKTLPLPEPLRRAFVQVCQRRVVWRAQRSGTALPALPLEADGRTDDLAGTVKILFRLAGSGKETWVLTNCLLDLYQRHTRGELPPDGKTR